MKKGSLGWRVSCMLIKEIMKWSPRDLMLELEPWRDRWDSKAEPTETGMSRLFSEEADREGGGDFASSCQMIGSTEA